MITVAATKLQNNFPKDAAVSYLTDSLKGILKGNADLEECQ